MTCTSYCEKIEEIFDAMIRLADEVLPENRKELIEYLSSVWGPVMVWVGSTGSGWVRSTKSGWVIQELRGKFNSYVIAEEAKLHRDLEGIKYDISCLDTVRLIARNTRPETVIVQTLSLRFNVLISEQFLFPMLYLVLKRDLEKISLARKYVLSNLELADASETLLFISRAAEDRSESLRGEPQMLSCFHFHPPRCDSHLQTPES